MKYWWIGLGLLMGTVHAAVYPASLNHGSGHEFTRMAEFENIYQEFYRDVRGELIEEILKRVMEDIPEEWKEKLLWTLDFDDLDLSGKMEVSLADKSQKLSRTTQQTRQQDLSGWVELERQFLRLERELARRQAIEQMFVDGNQGVESDGPPEAGVVTAPFDVVADLNQLDWLLYGEKATYPDPEYAHRAEEPLDEHEDDSFTAWDDEEPWFAPSDETVTPYERDTDQVSADSSVSGTLQAINDLMEMQLFSKCPSLAAEKVTKNMLDSPYAAGILAGSGGSMQMAGYPVVLSEDRVPVEMHTLKIIKDSGLDALLSQLFQQESSVKLRRNRGNVVFRERVFGQVGRQASTLKNLFDRQILRVQRQRENQLGKEENTQFGLGLDSLQGGFFLWLEKMGGSVDGDGEPSAESGSGWRNLLKNISHKPVL